MPPIKPKPEAKIAMAWVAMPFLRLALDNLLIKSKGWDCSRPHLNHQSKIGEHKETDKTNCRKMPIMRGNLDLVPLFFAPVMASKRPQTVNKPVHLIGKTCIVGPSDTKLGIKTPINETAPIIANVTPITVDIALFLSLFSRFSKLLWDLILKESKPYCEKHT